MGAGHHHDQVMLDSGEVETSQALKVIPRAAQNEDTETEIVSSHAEVTRLRVRVTSTAK